jgi:hypothetical protein
MERFMYVHLISRGSISGDRNYEQLTLLLVSFPNQIQQSLMVRIQIYFDKIGPIWKYSIIGMQATMRSLVFAAQKGKITTALCSALWRQRKITTALRRVQSHI